MLYILGIVFIAFCVMFSIALHEVGHLLPAKKFGVRVTQYMIGFGPTLFSFRRGETEYGFKAIPLGGYISMIGMYPPGKSSKNLRNSNTGMYQSLIASAREHSFQQIRVEDEGRMFYQLPVWKRLIIMFGGPLANLLIATFFLSILLVGVGTQELRNGISSVSKCLEVAEDEVSGSDMCPQGSVLSPAAAVGLESGDRIVGLDGVLVSEWEQLSTIIRGSAGKSLDLEYERNGVSSNVLVTPLAVSSPSGEVVGMLGFSPKIEHVRKSLLDVPQVLGENLYGTAKVVLNLPAKMVSISQAAFSSKPRDLDGPISVVGVGRIAGEVSAADDLLPSTRIYFLMNIIVSLNIALFVFNMIPLLPLDGGHIAGGLYEAVRKRLLKLFGRPDPGPFDIAKLLPLTYVVAVLLMIMGVLLIYTDIVKPITLF